MKMSNEIKVTNYAIDPHLDREVKEFLTVLNTAGSPPLESMDPYDARKVLEDAQASVKVEISGIRESHKTIVTDGYSINLTIVHPEGKNEKLPAFIFIHGGGWVLGDYRTHKRLIRDIVVLSGFPAVYVDYTRTPDAEFPQAINEIFAAVKWIAANGDEINVDGSRLAIVGNSVGGNMAAVTAIRAAEINNPDFKCQILLWPVTDASMEHESWKLYAKDRFLTASMMSWMHDMYTKDIEDRGSKYVSPINADPGDLQGLPPTFIVVAENDILRDEGEEYGRILDIAGVKVTTVRYNGTIHDFGLLNGLANVPSTKAMLEHVANELKKYLR
jgi:acetyl esterase